jgi:flagellar biosynthesis protein FlhB
MKAKDKIWILVVGLIVSISSIALAFNKINFWYFPGVVGFWLVFDYFSSMKNKNTALQILTKSKYEFLKLYFLMFMLGCTIEVLGRFIFNLWIYPPYHGILPDIANLLFYPFILFSFREMYESIKIVIKNKVVTFITSMIIGIIIWEVPNLFSVDWIYTIPYLDLEIFKMNIVVIIGWSILIGFPILVYNEFFRGGR